jgi:hypothetical protein
LAEFFAEYLYPCEIFDYHEQHRGFLPRLHGFHRFLPRLWELFYCAKTGFSAAIATTDGIPTGGDSQSTGP